MFLFTLKNMAIRKFKITNVACFIFLLVSADIRDLAREWKPNQAQFGQCFL